MYDPMTDHGKLSQIIPTTVSHLSARDLQELQYSYTLHIHIATYTITDKAHKMWQER